MQDHEIRVKPLSDWKPETDIKLQKAFGKFVEEAGELQEECFNFDVNLYTDQVAERHALEDEMADCDAVIDMIVQASEGRLVLSTDPRDLFNKVRKTNDGYTGDIDLVQLISGVVGKTLKVVGRCQIQGLSANDFKTKVPNVQILGDALVFCRATIWYVRDHLGLDTQRMEERKQAKIDTKIPWVMGTATDLLPST